MQELFKELQRIPRIEIRGLSPAKKGKQTAHLLTIRFKRSGSVSPHTIRKVADQVGYLREEPLQEYGIPRRDFTFNGKLFHTGRFEGEQPFVSIGLYHDRKLPTIALAIPEKHASLSEDWRKKLVQMFNELAA